MDDKNPFNDTGDCGYSISQTDLASKDALTRVLEVLRRLRRTGAETRGWTRQTFETLDEKLHALTHLSDRESGQAILADLVAWEGHILQVIRHYMQEASDTINRIKTMNPPLTNNQLRPFIEAVEADRAETIEALGPLTEAIEKLAGHKRSNTRPSSRNAA